MFKIGDRVQRNDEGAREYYGPGTVIACKSNAGATSLMVRHDKGDEVCWFEWGLEMVPAAPRGPRPLPIRQRVVLTAGKTLRQPPRAVWTQVHSLHSPRTSDGVRPWFA